jgi:hypothetical protein
VQQRADRLHDAGHRPAARLGFGVRPAVIAGTVVAGPILTRSAHTSPEFRGFRLSHATRLDLEHGSRDKRTTVVRSAVRTAFRAVVRTDLRADFRADFRLDRQSVIGSAGHTIAIYCADHAIADVHLWIERLRGRPRRALDRHAGASGGDQHRGPRRRRRGISDPPLLTDLRFNLRLMRAFVELRFLGS